jgi:hypothetical protein
MALVTASVMLIQKLGLSSLTYLLCSMVICLRDENRNSTWQHLVSFHEKLYEDAGSLRDANRNSTWQHLVFLNEKLYEDAGSLRDANRNSTRQHLVSFHEKLYEDAGSLEL